MKPKKPKKPKSRKQASLQDHRPAPLVSDISTRQFTSLGWIDLSEEDQLEKLKPQPAKAQEFSS